ncbi:uncharacterized protein L969DRAFT_54222 [Mixia osmundae IAM 14324]|uniref:Magnesium transporter n=1 Tax=Mixia osmundae (strain CBS 9802 / IAM 14324 / JCM 22182 / KY 12970) TaxID=764103 RepID=G7E2D2_MIXOS|nr:uncharacterized protein L969DRAFT_54222 [Mixia osmundae IAM 14324]KEI36864.1 hypothetical protein L969DRAFT_54222 [Mixia osmundae IAM 14324]GAA96992.1 hypothetical protein E5Q_03666 [Mixia osmundae IAM 14324]
MEDRLRPSLREGRTTSSLRSAALGVQSARRIASGASAQSAKASENAGRRHYAWVPQYSDQGIDPRTAQLDDLDQPIHVCIVDYSDTRHDEMLLSNQEAIEHLHKPRPSWSKVRYINVSGHSWDVLKTLALKYELHPLALEDTLHISETRSKSDYYANALFLNMHIFALLSEGGDSAMEPPPSYSAIARPTVVAKNQNHLLDRLRKGARRPAAALRKDSSDPSSLEAASAEETLEQEPATEEQTRPDKTRSSNSRKDGLARSVFQPRVSETRKDILKVTKAYRVPYETEQLSIYLLKDGTLLTIFQNDIDPQTGIDPLIEPIFERLRDKSSLLRTSEDPSLLLQSVLDAVVDRLVDLCEAFRHHINTVEDRTLIRAETDSVKHLFVLSNQILTLKRTLTPIHSLIRALQRDDESRAAAVLPESAHRERDQALRDGRGHELPRIGYVSPRARLYLGDVLDHMDSVLSSLDLFGSQCQQLVDYTFNMLSFNTNESMKALSMVTIVFLPLGFLTGYFGQNFMQFAEIQGSVTYFWRIAIPLTIVIVALFSGSYILRLITSAFRSYRREAKYRARRKLAAQDRARR